MNARLCLIGLPLCNQLALMLDHSAANEQRNFADSPIMHDTSDSSSENYQRKKETVATDKSSI